MSSICFTACQIGENGSIEYTWSNNICERIIQLSFQLTRTKDQNTINNLRIQTDNLLTDISLAYKTAFFSKEEYIGYMSLLYRMIGYTRDIIDGKGEYALSYMLLEVWHTHYPDLAKFALKHFVISPEDSPEVHPYGSWKDIKYLHKYNISKSLIDYGLQLMIDQLKLDITSDNPSLVAKWVPREKSQFGHMFNELAVDYFGDYIKTAKTENARIRAIIKAKMDFRKLITSLNKKIDTVQIKQCCLNWSDIDPEKQTSITMHKQKRAFLNIDKNGVRRQFNFDRISCAIKFDDYSQKAVKGEVEVKGKRVSLNDFVKEALDLCSSSRKVSNEAALLNAQWNNNSKQNGVLGKMIAMVDVSNSMSGDPMNSAIALGIRVAEKSMLGKRLLTFSSSPSWVNLTDTNNFVDMVDLVRRSDWGMNANFYDALKLILDAIISQKLNPTDVEDMVLVVFSDMQMDQTEIITTSLISFITKQYADAGRQLWNKPFKTPHIIFWNLRSGSGFPTMFNQKNCSMMSGFSPALLNTFCEDKLDNLHSCTPWSLFVKSLLNERYNVLDHYICKTL